MTADENRELERLARAVEELGRVQTSQAGDIKAIVQWTRDRRQTCDRHENDIGELRKEQVSLREKVVSGLTAKALAVSLVTALIVGLSIGVPLWIKVSSAAGG